MNTSTPLRSMFAGPAILLFAAGAAIACPPESEGREVPQQIIELGDGGGAFALRAANSFSWLDSAPAMGVFSDRPQQGEGVYFGPEEGQTRYRIVRPGTGRAEAQTFTATRGNGQASAKARAELGEWTRRAEAAQEDALTQADVARQRAEKQLRRRGTRLSTPATPAAPADANVLVEGRAIVIGPDGQVHELMMGGAPAAPAAPSAPQRMLLERGASGRGEAVAPPQEFLAIEGGPAAKVWIGVELAEPDAGIVRHFELEPGQTTEIARVYEDSPAAKAGLKDRDIVIEINGAAMAGPDILREIVGAANPGDPIRVTVLRKGRTHEIDLRPALREQPRTAIGRPLDPFAAAAAPSSSVGASNRDDLEQRMARIERMLEKLLEEESRD